MHTHCVTLYVLSLLLLRKRYYFIDADAKRLHML